MHQLNDVVGITPTSFFATNDHLFHRNFFLHFIEDLFNLCLGDIIYYNHDTNTTTSVLSRLCLPNGINTHPNHTLLYFTECLAGSLNYASIINKPGEDIRLEVVKKIDNFASAIDNIEVITRDGKGAESPELYIASHPKLLVNWTYFFQQTCFQLIYCIDACFFILSITHQAICILYAIRATLSFFFSSIPGDK